MKEKINLIFEKVWNNKWLWGLFFLVAIVPIACSIIKGGILSCDSAYYLLYVGKIAEGFVPYKTISLGYTPLWFYLMYILSYPFGISCYNPEYFLVIHYLFAFGVAFFIYKISFYFSDNKKISLLSVWLFLMISHWIQGNCILLEIPSLFWGLLAVTCILYHGKKKDYWFFLYGVLAACSFLVKQFGLGFLLLCALLILFEKNCWRKMLFYFLGYIIPIVICFCFWGESLLPLIFSSYGTKSAVEAGYDKSLGMILYVWFDTLVYIFVRVIPAFLGMLLFVFIPIKDKTKRKEWLFCLCGFFGFSLQFIFSRGMHYFLYLIPFAIILSTLVLTYSTNKILKYIQYALVCVTIVLGLYSTYHNRVYKLYYKGQQDETNQLIAEKVKNIVSDSEKLWIVHGGLFSVYYYSQLVPPNIQERGYSFGPLGVSEKKAWQQAASADYVLKYNETYPYESFFTDSLCNFVESHKAIPITKYVTLYDMNKELKNN